MSVTIKRCARRFNAARALWGLVKMKCKALLALFAALALFCLMPAFAQEEAGAAAVLRYGYSGRYSYTERANLSTYINGKYVGLTHRETRADLNCIGQSEAGLAFSGFFYAAEETLRDTRNVSLPLDAAIPVSFTVTEKGRMLFGEDNGYPRMRDFPAFPDGEIKAGDYWEAQATRIVDPKNTGAAAEIPVQVAYTFVGEEEFRGKKVYRIKAKYATRMGRYTSVRAVSRDPDLADATGTHDADILVDSETGLLMMIAETLDETFAYRDGSTIRFRGSSAVYTQQSAQSEKGVLPRAINRIAREAQSEAETKGIVMPESVDDMFPQEGPSAAGAGPGGGIARQGGAGAGSGGSIARQGGAGAGPGGSIARQGGAGAGPGGSIARQGGAQGSGGNIARQGRAQGSGGSIAQIAAAIQQGAGAGGGTEDSAAPFAVDVTEQGIKLSVRDIRFKPDSDEILPQETWRLDAIAQTLKIAEEAGGEGQTFLVEGHTAAVGKPNGEKELSVRRAQAITRELTRRGISADRFMYAGYGGTRPIADNVTAEGRAQNRRVEITIVGAE